MILSVHAAVHNNSGLQCRCLDRGVQLQHTNRPLGGGMREYNDDAHSETGGVWLHG